MMRAIVYAGAGGTEVITVAEVPRPAAGLSQVRVRVRAAGLNRADILQRRGSYPAPHGWPDAIPGLEFAGEVEAVRPGATRWKVGDRVMGLAGSGAHAEAVVLHEDELLPIPDGMTFTDAAAIPEVFLTAFDALEVRGRVQEGERVLIHAVGSGLGTAAAQLAHRMGATVIGTSRTAGKLARAVLFGVDVPVDTSATPLREAVTEPVDVIIDVLGGPAFGDHLALLAPRGRLVVLGFLAGSTVPEVDLGPILRKRLEIVGTAMRTRESAERIALAHEFTVRVLPLFAHGQLRPVVDRVIPMTDIAEAHRLMERDETFGKIVLAWEE